MQRKPESNHADRYARVAQQPPPCPNRLQVWLTIQRPGVYYGQCSELCGANHAFMPIVVEAVTPRQFLTEYLKKWMQ